jgi:hypothetical protein
MLTLFNEHYYLDISSIENQVNLAPTTDESGKTEQHISVVKYEMIKTMIDVLITEREDADEALGPKSAVSIPYKLAWNTLLNIGILKKY